MPQDEPDHFPLNNLAAEMLPARPENNGLEVLIRGLQHNGGSLAKKPLNRRLALIEDHNHIAVIPPCARVHHDMVTGTQPVASH